MKIVIDIPEQIYKELTETAIIVTEVYPLTIDRALTEGKPYEERKTGEWLDTADEYDKRAQRHDYYCLECKTFAGYFIGGSEDWWCYNPPKYCPNCGAKMEGDA